MARQTEILGMRVQREYKGPAARLVELLDSALEKSKIKKEIKKQLINKVFEYLLEENNLINLYSIAFCKINFLKNSIFD